MNMFKKLAMYVSILAVLAIGLIGTYGPEAVFAGCGRR